MSPTIIEMQFTDNVFSFGFNHNIINKNSFTYEVKHQNYLNEISQNISKKSILSLTPLSTCNRLEFYGYGDVKQAIELVFKTYSLQQVYQDHLTIRKADQAIQHIFNVAGGLDSQLIGDLEILGQFKEAFKLSKQHNMLNGYMERLANTSIQAAKSIRSTTELTSGTTSLSYAAIQLIREANITKEANILVIGAGKFGQNIAKNIQSYLPNNQITITNRTYEKSKQLADIVNGDTIPFEEIERYMNKFDVIISAIDNKGKAINTEHLNSNQSFLLIDLSTPYYFDVSIKKKPNVQLFNLADASAIINKTLSNRADSIPLAKQILDKHLHEFIQWSQLYQKSNTIKAWKEHTKYIHSKCPHFKNLSKEEAEVILKKSVSKFALYLRDLNESTQKEDEILSDYLKSNAKENCLLCNQLNDVHSKKENCIRCRK